VASRNVAESFALPHPQRGVDSRTISAKHFVFGVAFIGLIFAFSKEEKDLTAIEREFYGLSGFSRLILLDS
jgi:hypothetical protein